MCFLNNLPEQENLLGSMPITPEGARSLVWRQLRTPSTSRKMSFSRNSLIKVALSIFPVPLFVAEIEQKEHVNNNKAKQDDTLDPIHFGFLPR